MNFRVLCMSPRSGSIHVAFDDERTACNTSLQVVSDGAGGKLPPPPDYWKPTRREVNCMGCLAALSAAQRYAAERREAEAARYRERAVSQ